jgi:precorrin-6B methylase 2
VPIRWFKPYACQKIYPCNEVQNINPFFDTVLKVLMKDTEMRSQFVAQLNMKDNENILDLGCGTGTLGPLTIIFSAKYRNY